MTSIACSPHATIQAQQRGITREKIRVVDCRSVPPPWHADSAARRTITELEARMMRLRPKVDAVMARKPAFNRVAVHRLLERFERALAPDIRTCRHIGDHHAALTASILIPARPAAANDNLDEPRGIAACSIMVVAGKKKNLRSITRTLDVSRHSLVRVAERGGLREVGEQHDLVLEGVRNAETILLAYAKCGIDRLAIGSVLVLVPAGFGAFLGYLRLLTRTETNGEESLLPVIEAHTWLDRTLFATAQDEACSTIFACTGESADFARIVEAMARLPTSRTGDRRLATGLAVAATGGRPSEVFARAIISSAPLAAARLRSANACPDQIVEERRSVRALPNNIGPSRNRI